MKGYKQKTKLPAYIKTARTLGILAAIFITTASDVLGQNGYVKIDRDSIISGYIRFYTSFADGLHGIEVWRTKQDKHPLKIPRRMMIEYAVKKDTFKVLHQFSPFPDKNRYFEIIDAKRLSGGKVNLYRIYDGGPNNHHIHHGLETPVIMDFTPSKRQMLIYILEEKTTFYLAAIPQDKAKMMEALAEFFPKKYLSKYEEVNGKIQYGKIPKLVKLYNSR